MILYGTTHHIGDRITTEQILASDQRIDDDPALLASACLASVDATLAERVAPGDILLTGHTFGGGPQSDLVILSLQALGFVVLICASAEPRFVETAHTNGLPILISPDAVAEIGAGRVVRLNLSEGSIEDRLSGRLYHATPCTPDLITSVRLAELYARMRRVIDEEGFGDA